MPMAQGFWVRSPRIHRYSAPLKKHLHGRAPLQGRSEILSALRVHVNARQWRGAMSIVMRATLHDRATNTYYGQWLGKKARKHAAK
jgi:hypothetical protein